VVRKRLKQNFRFTLTLVDGRDLVELVRHVSASDMRNMIRLVIELFVRNRLVRGTISVMYSGLLDISAVI
jgi:hypothetical protein